MGIGADCSMRIGLARYTSQQLVQVTEGGQADLRTFREAPADAALALGHPVRDDDEPAGGREAHERSVARGPAMGPRHRERLAPEGMPRVVDGNRS